MRSSSRDVAGEAGEPGQPGLVLECVVELLERQVVAQQVEQRSRVDRARRGSPSARLRAG